jgi:hypothetical protein
MQLIRPGPARPTRGNPLSQRLCIGEFSQEGVAPTQAVALAGVGHTSVLPLYALAPTAERHDLTS